MRHTHPSTDGHVEAGQLALFVHYSNEPQIVGENINVIGWWYCNRDFELKEQ